MDFYQPKDLEKCPNIALVVRGTHSHPDPRPSKTPRTIEIIFNALLDCLDWRLADASPRRILLDTGFMNGLRNALEWDGKIEPCLSNLHPSLGNADHTRRLINKLQKARYPNGTGFKGGLN
jgi:hypothetical protein